MVKVKEDMTGKRFGKLLVIKQVEDYIDPHNIHRARWLCECECGQSTIVKGADLRKPNGTRSCGCLKDEQRHMIIEQLIGQRFGKLVVLSRNMDYTNKTMFNCICDCGNTCIVWEWNLRRNDRKPTHSCGCIQKEAIQQIGYNNKKENQWSEKLYDEHGEYYIGLASNTNTPFYVDAEDIDIVQPYTWWEHISVDNYHALESKDIMDNSVIRMSWLIVGKYYDHIDRNPLNNRRYNLRPATASQNGYNSGIQRNNTSGVIGVCWDTFHETWCAHITVNYKYIYLGSFQTFNDAVKARLVAEQKYAKEFAPQQHLFKQYGILPQLKKE